MPTTKPFGILDGKKIDLEKEVWELPEEDRVRVVVQEVQPDGTIQESRPFRFIGTQGAPLDDKTMIIG